MMSWLHQTLARFSALFTKRRLDRELEEDLATHIALLTDEYISRGMDPVEARRQARLSFGSVDSAMEIHRDARSLRWVETAVMDLRYAARLVRRQPLLMSAVVLTLGIGIGAPTSAFSLLNGFVFRAPVSADPDAFFSVVRLSRYDWGAAATPDEYVAFREGTQTARELAAWSTIPLSGPIGSEDPAQVPGLFVSCNFFRLLGVDRPLSGRLLGEQDCAAPVPVAVISERLWRRRFNADPSIVGSSLRYGGDPVTIVGVVSAPPVQRQADDPDFVADVWAPYTSHPVMKGASGFLQELSHHGARDGHRWLKVAGLLAPGTSRATAEAEFRTIDAGQLVLTTVSAAIGAFTAWLVVDAVVGILPIALPDAAPLSVSLGVLATVAVLAIVLGLSIGAIASVNLVLHDVQRELGASSATLSGRLPRRTAQFLIAGEVALALVLAAAGGSLIRSYSRLMAIDLGFDPSGVVAFNVAPVDIGADAKLQFYSQVAERVSLLPTVEAVGLVDHFPLGETSIGVSASAGGKSVGVGFRQIMAGYFAALGVRAMQGHLPDGEGPHDQSAAVINESAARRLFDSQALGSSFSIGKRTFWVSGVVPDFVHGGPLKKASPEVFVPFDPTDGPSRILHSMTVVLRTRASGRASSDAIGQVIRGIGPVAVVAEIRTADEWLGDRVAIPRHRAILFVLLAAVGLLLMGVLIFSTTGYAVAGRRGEIALRMALGAQPAAVVRRTLLESGWPVLWGLAAGLLLVALSSRTLRSFLYEISPTDAGTVSAVATIVAGLALLAAWIPARRVVRVDPVATLRQD